MPRSGSGSDGPWNDKKVKASDEDATFQDPKRRKMTHDDGRDRQQCRPTGLQTRHYTIGWLCALPMEMASAVGMLDWTHESLPVEANDTNAYMLGNIGPHNIAIACLGEYGTINAAHVAANMERSFPSIRAYLMVGIGGGVPGSVDLRLGDIVVGRRVMQYEMGKVVGDGLLQRPTVLSAPRSALSTAISKLRAIHESHPTRIPGMLEEMLARYPFMDKYGYPDGCEDRLFLASYDHTSASANCEGCDRTQLVQRQTRRDRDPRIYYGAIASGNKVMKHGATRDKIAQELEVLCFEMEAAGLTDHLPCLVVRGICDYSDSHKSKEWQWYAAAVAAAYAKELLTELPWTQAQAALVTATHSRVGLDENYKSRRRRRLMHSLRFDQMASRESTIRSAHSTTCNWFLEHECYRDWSQAEKYSEHHGFLWISGKPGSGKSTIMKFLSSRARQHLRPDGALACFFFNARGDHLEKSTIGMFRSILFQLLERFTDLQRVLDDQSLISGDPTICPSLEVLEVLLRKAIPLLGRRNFTCFVDALDECDEDQVRDMVEYFEDLNQNVENDLVQFRICFSSRHYPYVRLRHGIKLTLEDQNGHRDDLAKYVQSRLGAEKSPRTDELCDLILQRAAGVFMWVVLVVDILDKELRRGRVFAAKKRLQQIPEKLSDVFREIIGRDDRDMEDFLLCVQWILYAKRPLSPYEFYYAICSGLPTDELAEAMSVPIAGDIARKFVISASKGLAEVTRSSHPTVQFIHESVRDFLIKENGLCELWPQFGDSITESSHDKIKGCCYAYMKLALQQGAEELSEATVMSGDETCQNTTNLQQAYPFLNYSTNQVLWHADFASKTICQNPFLDRFPLESWIRLNNLYHYQNLKKNQYTLEASLVYIFADKNLPNLIRDRRRLHSCIDIYGEELSYPLFAALVGKSEQALRALLGLSSSPYDNNALILDLMAWSLIRVDIRESPLTWAAKEGHADLAKLIIQNGADMHRCDADGMDALSTAAANGRHDVVKLLLGFGAEAQFPQQYTHRATVEAARNGHVSILKLLIDNGADIQSEDGPARLSMSGAAEGGYIDVVRLLIENGVNLGHSNEVGPAALFGAVQYGHVEIVELLLEHGIAADAQCGRAIAIAAKNGDANIARVLIKHGADANSVRSLVSAARNGHEVFVKMLLEHGADAGSRAVRSICERNDLVAVIELLDNFKRSGSL